MKNKKGKEKEQTDYFFRFKAHVSIDAQSGTITSLEITSGEVYDGLHFCSLADHDVEIYLAVNTHTANKGDDDGDNHYSLELRGLHSYIHLKKIRTKKKDDNKQVWLELKKTDPYETGLKECFKIEGKFGEAKQRHGFGSCRYIETTRFAILFFPTAIVLNLKRMVKLLTGVNFKARAYAAE